MNSKPSTMKKIFLAIAAAIFSLTCMAQSTQTQTVFINDNGDGTITVRATGSGKTKDVAIMMAQKQAVRDVIFNGVNVPGNVRLSKPLFYSDMNASTNYEDFFNTFFKDKGVYTKFISVQDRKSDSNIVDRRQNQVTVQTTVRVFRSDLKTYLKENNFID